MAEPPPLPGKVDTQNFFIGLSYVKLNSEQKSSLWTQVKNSDKKLNVSKNITFEHGSIGIKVVQNSILHKISQ